MARVVSHSW